MLKCIYTNASTIHHKCSSNVHRECKIGNNSIETLYVEVCVRERKRERAGVSVNANEINLIRYHVEKNLCTKCETGRGRE